MAFKSFVENARQTNQKMASMGQSIDIQKQPRPKEGSTYTPSRQMTEAGADEIEMKLYPKRFKGNNNFSELNNSTQKMIHNVEEDVVEVEVKEKPKMIGDDDEVIIPRSKQVVDDRHCNIIKGVVNDSTRGSYSKAGWEGCKHLKQDGNIAYCKEFLSLCGKERCRRVCR